jgi:uncharacterized membrane protein YdjX (TVP38/TMEM64 family)
MTSKPESNSWQGWAVPLLTVVGISLMVFILAQSVGFERIRQTIASAGPLAPVLYIAVRMSTMIFAPLTSGPLQMASGAVFGLWQGLLYSLLAETLAGSINFWVSRRFGKPLVRRFVGERGLNQIEQFYHRAGEALTLVYARLFMSGVYDFVSYAAGLTPISYRTYVLVSVIVGVIPVFGTVAIGSVLTELDSRFILAAGLMSVLFVVPLFFYPRLRRWFDRRFGRQEEHRLQMPSTADLMVRDDKPQ